MFKRTTPRKLGQWATGITLMLIALTATGLSLMMNISYGLQIGTAAGIASGLSDVALAVIPVVGIAIGWSRQLRIAFLICAIYSAWTATNYMADHYGQHLLSKRHEAGEHETLKDRIASLEASLASRRDAIDYEMKTGCGPKCRGHMEEAAEISDKLDAARASLADTPPVEISGLAKHASTVTGRDKQDIAQAINIVSVIVVLILIELLRHLNSPAARMLKLAMRKPRQPKQKETTAPAPPPANVVPLHSERVERGLRNLTGT